jgi:SAM-dependent methyltransferase
VAFVPGAVEPNGTRSERRAAVIFDWRRVPRRLRNSIRLLRARTGRKELPETWWRTRSGDAWTATYWNDDGSPRRDYIIDAVRSSFGAPASVLDVGCNAAPNLRRIAAEFPGCRLSGFDINQEAIDVAVRRFAEAGIPAELSVGSYYDVLPRVATDSIDVIVSSYALAYVPPENLREVLTELVRIARRGLVLAEPMAFGGTRTAGVLNVPMHDWRHDYAGALSGIGVPPGGVAVFDVPTPGADDSGLLVADLRHPGRPRLERSPEAIGKTDARSPSE